MICVPVSWSHLGNQRTKHNWGLFKPLTLMGVLYPKDQGLLTLTWFLQEPQPLLPVPAGASVSTSGIFSLSASHHPVCLQLQVDEKIQRHPSSRRQRGKFDVVQRFVDVQRETFFS